MLAKSEFSPARNGIVREALSKQSNSKSLGPSCGQALTPRPLKIRAYGPARTPTEGSRHRPPCGHLGDFGVGHPRVFGVRYIFGWGLIKVGGGGLAMGGWRVVRAQS